MQNQINAEVELLIQQLKQLNEQFSQSLDTNQQFDQSKAIYLKIKEANSKLKQYLAEGYFQEEAKLRDIA